MFKKSGMKIKILILLLLSISTLTHAQPFSFIVAADGSGTHTTVQSAIDACPDNQRSIIFIKNGTYYGQTYLGTKTVASNKIISLVGESRDGVVLTYDKSLPMVTKFEEATTFQIYAKDFYAENITFANTAGVAAGQALALYSAGDKATFKNCYIRGFQDTYRAKKGTRAYMKSCKIEGTVDFIYAGGTVFFDDCELHCLQGGGYIVAPEDAAYTIPAASTACGKVLKLEFIFRNCNITAESGVADNSYYLGRPWNVTSGAFYLNCTLGKHINPKGWKEWSGNETTASFAEYNSKDTNGNPVDVTSRVSWSFQLPKTDVDNLLTPAAVYARVSAIVYDPVSQVVAPLAPTTLLASGKSLAWSTVSDAAGYVIYKNGQYLANTTSTTFTDESASEGVYTLKSIGTSGQLSEVSATVTGLADVQKTNISATLKNDILTFNEPVTLNIIGLDAKLQLSNTQFIQQLNITQIKSGIYLLQMTNTDGFKHTQKLIITHK